WPPFLPGATRRTMRLPTAANPLPVEIGMDARRCRGARRTRTMIQTGRDATVLVSTGWNGTLRNSGAPLADHRPTMWKIAAHAGKESRPRPAFLLVTALIAGAPEGTRTPNLLIRSRKVRWCRSQP